MKKVSIFLADGFEEVEALTPTDLLRRAGAEVTLVSTGDKKEVAGKMCIRDRAEVVSDLEASITWWTYPVFVQDEDQADGTYEQTLIRKFNEKYPNIK